MSRTSKPAYAINFGKLVEVGNSHIAKATHKLKSKVTTKVPIVHEAWPALSKKVSNAAERDANAKASSIVNASAVVIEQRYAGLIADKIMRNKNWHSSIGCNICGSLHVTTFHIVVLSHTRQDECHFNKKLCGDCDEKLQKNTDLERCYIVENQLK